MMHFVFQQNKGNADFSLAEKDEYLDELEARASAGALQIDYVNLPITTQFTVQKAMAKAQKGTVVELGDGTKLDARDVKNGSGGKRGHRAKNNRLKDVDGSCAGSEDNGDKGIDDPLREAMKRSIDDEFLKNEREKERLAMEMIGDKLLKSTGSKEKKVIDVDKDDDKDEKLDGLNESKKAGVADLANEMFERVNKKMKKNYSAGIKDLNKIDDDDDKKMKKK